MPAHSWETYGKTGVWREIEEFPFVAAAAHRLGVSNEPVKEHWVINEHFSWTAISGASIEQGGKNLEEQVTLVPGT